MAKQNIKKENSIWINFYGIPGRNILDIHDVRIGNENLFSYDDGL